MYYGEHPNGGSEYKTCSAEAKSLCVNKADSVKVPDGPRYPTLKLVTSPTPEG